MNIRTLIILLATLVFAGCAKQGMPTGGQKDVTPPQMCRMTPPNNSLNSNSESFTIEFDEYVVIKDAENNILISPPMKERPEFKTKGKGIKVTIKDSLQPNTTYLFQFKEAIADFTEGNPLPSLEYVFSTGDYIDSMSVNGKVVEALSMEADKNPVSVWLLEENRYQQAVKAMSDTNTKFPQPNYITRTDKEGRFSFNNIKPGNFRIIAIKDEDKNTMIGASETIAFTDSAITAEIMVKKGNGKQDSLTDSMSIKTQTFQHILRLSTPSAERQRLTSSKFVSAGKAVITSHAPLISPRLDAGEEEIVWRLNNKRDTLTLWTLDKECDSLRLIVVDTTGINDTLNLRWHARKRNAKGARDIKLPTACDMRFNNTSLPYFDTLKLIFTTPLDTKRCRLDSAATIMLLKDSSIASCDAVMDSSAMRVFLPYRFLQSEKYSVTIIKGHFYDIYGLANDTLRATVTTTKAEDYGNLTINVENGVSEGQLIIELLDEKGNVTRTKKTSGNDKVIFENIKPAKHRVRAMVDSNGNGKWDVGDFASQRQPEEVIYLDKTLEIRANWDFEEQLRINN